MFVRFEGFRRVAWGFMKGLCNWGVYVGSEDWDSGSWGVERMDSPS